MKEKFKKIAGDSLIRFSTIAALFFIFVEAILILLSFNKLPPYIPFFNSMPWGRERLATPGTMIYLFISFIAVFIVNNFFSAIFYNTYPLVARVLAIASLLFVFLGFLASLQIIILIF